MARFLMHTVLVELSPIIARQGLLVTIAVWVGRVSVALRVGVGVAVLTFPPLRPLACAGL
jgi:hypothetical protein